MGLNTANFSSHSGSFGAECTRRILFMLIRNDIFDPGGVLPECFLTTPVAIRQSSKSSYREHQTIGPQHHLKLCWHPQQSGFLCWKNMNARSSYDRFPRCVFILTAQCHRMHISQDLRDWFVYCEKVVKQDHYHLSASSVYRVPFWFTIFQRASATFLVSNANQTCLHLFIVPIICQDHLCYLFIQCIRRFDFVTLHLNAIKYQKYCWDAPFHLFLSYLPNILTKIS